MKEGPILFSGEMVRSIREDRKNQTRRVCSPQPFADETWSEGWAIKSRGKTTAVKSFNIGCYQDICPYGKPGDRLWVRETWAADKECSAIAYRADLSPEDEKDEGWLKRNAKKLRKEYAEWRWKPSIHMPRWASRLTLEIVKVRVERVQDISEEDAKAEGVEPLSMTQQDIDDLQISDSPPWEKEMSRLMGPGSFSYKFTYNMLWDELNAKRQGGKYAWKKNPWVWVIEFKRIKASQ